MNGILRRTRNYVLILCTLVVAALQGFAQTESSVVAVEVSNAESFVGSTATNTAQEAGGLSGMKFGFCYRGEAFTNLHGGFAERRAAALGSAEMSVGIDMAKAGVGRGQVKLSVQSVHGHGINEIAVGAKQAASNLESPSFDRLIEAWYSDSYLQDRLRIKVGRQYGDSEFQGAENAGNFLNASYGLIPTVPMPTYPSPEMGVSVWAAPWKRVSFGTGIYRGRLLDPVSETERPVRTGAFTVAETKIEPFGSESSQSVVVRVGAWHQNGGAWLNTNSAERNLAGNYGFYAAADYWFHKRSEADRGPGLFMQWGMAPADRNEIHQYVGTGISLPSFIKRRQQDGMGVAVNHAGLSAGGGESSIETFYRARVTKNVMLQPDLQWVHKPAGTRSVAVVGGVRVAVEF